MPPIAKPITSGRYGRIASADTARLRTSIEKERDEARHEIERYS
jgi:hypothetical protein